MDDEGQDEGEFGTNDFEGQSGGDGEEYGEVSTAWRSLIYIMH